MKLGGTIKNRLKEGEVWVPEAKTAAALIEPVVMPRSTMDLLEKYRGEGEYICFPVPNAKKPFLTSDAYLLGWKKLCAALEIPPNTDPYTLKHGLIAELLMAGHSVDAVTLMTRHTTREMVMRIYAAINSADLAMGIDDVTNKSKK